MDLSSELVHALLPVYMTVVLGASMLALGVVEGIAEATASIVKVFSGALSDRMSRRKPLVVLGYALAMLSKPLFPLAASVPLVLAARFMDRLGKGIRGAPRDALIADVTPEGLRGAAYGLRQALDTVGAFAGPLAAIGLMLIFASDVRAVLWFAVIPAIIAVAVVCVAVREPKTRARAEASRPFSRASLREFDGRFWLVVAIGVVMTLARFSEAFLVVRAQDLGLALAMVPLVLVVMNVVYTAVAYPAGVGRGSRLPKGAPRLGIARIDRRRSAARAKRIARTILRGARALGLAHGTHAGAALDAGRRCGARAAARYRVRRVPLRIGRRAARRQRDRRLALANPGSAVDVLRGGDL